MFQAGGIKQKWDILESVPVKRRHILSALLQERIRMPGFSYVCDFLNLYILKRKRNATISKMVVPSFSSKKSASDNEIAKNRYLPCIQHQSRTAVTYGWRAATRNVRQPPFLKSQSSKIVPILRKNVLNQYRFLKAKG